MKRVWVRRVGEFELCAKLVCKESHTEIPIILQILEVKLEFHRENRTHRATSDIKNRCP